MKRQLKYSKVANQASSIISLPMVGNDYNANNFEEWFDSAFYNPSWTNNLIDSFTFDDGTGILSFVWNDTPNTSFDINLDGRYALLTDLNDYQLLSEKAQADGYASLDSGGKIPTNQLPLELMEFKGNWNAATNTPTLANTDADVQGSTYRVSADGSVDFGAGAISFKIGDWVFNNGTIWDKGDNSDEVASVFGRTGVIVSQTSDYDADQIDFSPYLTLSSTDIQSAIEELKDELDLIVSLAETDVVLNDGNTSSYTKLKIKSLEIGDWDMNATSSINIAHGLTFTKIRSVSILIIEDTGTTIYDFDFNGNGSTRAGNYIINSTNIALTRFAGLLFDSTNFNSTSYNRGWVTILYEDT